MWPRGLRISIAQQANQIGVWLTEQTQGSEAVVDIVANQRHLWEAVFSMATNTKPRILICFNGETARGGFNERNTLCRVDREWVVAVMRGHGFKHAMNKDEPKENLATSFYDDCEAIRQLLRRMTSISAEPLDYSTMKPLPGIAQPGTANVFLDGYLITFTAASDIPALTNLAPGQDSEG